MAMIDLLNVLRALLLLPIAFAGAFTAFPFAERAMLPRTWQDVLIELAILTPAYVYSLAAVFWIVTWNAQRRFLGLSKIGWLIPICLAFAVGVCSVVLMATV
ncbi:MAG: hypothetical protein ABR915_20495 [Thermoguttaceae bacterium]